MAVPGGSEMDRSRVALKHGPPASALSRRSARDLGTEDLNPLLPEGGGVSQRRICLAFEEVMFPLVHAAALG